MNIQTNYCNNYCNNLLILDFPGGSCPGGNYSGAVVWELEVRGGGGDFIGGSCPGGIFIEPPSMPQDSLPCLCYLSIMLVAK